MSLCSEADNWLSNPSARTSAVWAEVAVHSDVVEEAATLVLYSPNSWTSLVVEWVSEEASVVEVDLVEEEAEAVVAMELTVAKDLNKTSETHLVIECHF